MLLYSQSQFSAFARDEVGRSHSESSCAFFTLSTQHATTRGTTKPDWNNDPINRTRGRKVVDYQESTYIDRRAS